MTDRPGHAPYGGGQYEQGPYQGGHHQGGHYYDGPYPGGHGGPYVDGPVAGHPGGGPVPAPAAAPARRRRSGGALVLGLLLGGALGAGGALYATGDLPFLGGGAPASLALPDELAGLVDEREVLGASTADPETVAERVQEREAIYAELTQSLSESRGGAAAVVRTYTDAELEEFVTVRAVADPSPALWASNDSDTLTQSQGMAVPMEWVETDDDVQCLMRPDAGFVPEGGDVEAVVVSCQYSDDEVTVWVEAGFGGQSFARGVEITRAAVAALERG